MTFLGMCHDLWPSSLDVQVCYCKQSSYKQLKYRQLELPMNKISVNMLQSKANNEELILVIAGVLTWGVIAWFGLSQPLSMGPWTVSLCGYIAFIILFLVSTRSQFVQKRKPLLSLLITLQAIITLTLIAIDHMLSQVLLIIWAAQLANIATRRQALITIFLVNALVWLISHQFWPQQDHGFTLLLFLGFELFAYGSAKAFQREKAAKKQQEELNLQLSITRDLLKQTSAQQERTRIARDLHDILGHQLSALSLQLEVLNHKVPDELKVEVQQSKQLAKDLLENIRQVVREKRADVGLDLHQSLQLLMKGLPNVSLSYEVDSDNPIKLSNSQLASELLLVLQEGVSNAIRHGDASELQLFMTAETKNQSRMLTIILKDNGSGNIKRKATGIAPGTGLTGMKERLEPYRGTIQLTDNSNANPKASKGMQLTIQCYEMAQE